MKLAIFGRWTDRTNIDTLVRFFDFLGEKQIDYLVHDYYALQLKDRIEDWNVLIRPFVMEKLDALAFCDFAYSFGGDGTFLNTVRYVGSSTPILGINFGRLGFLTTILQEDLIRATTCLMRDMYKINTRTGLVVESNPPGLFGDSPFGLNDLTLHKSQSNEMITVHTYVNGEFLNSYWGDGLLVATPTGSTAYSLSCGGPIIHPKAASFVITPVAPHSLTVRPIIIPDTYVISFELESRTEQAMVALDTRTELVHHKTEIAVRKADFEVKLVQIPGVNYLANLRDRLIWGKDTRN